jgi:hypothetical protein
VRKLFWITGFSLLSLFTADFLVSLADWSARLDWVRATLAEHPNVAVAVRSPLLMGLLLLLGFAFLWAERKVKLPRISARLVNCQVVPRMRTITVQALFDAQQEKPGWDRHEGTWDWFLEILLTNEAETPTTIEDVDFRLRRIPRLLGVRVPWTPWQKIFLCKHLTDLNGHCIHKNVSDLFDNADFRIPSLIEKTKNVPLTIGIGHRGWLRFESPNITQADLRNSGLDVWLVDAMEEKHNVRYRRGDEEKWDKNFTIMELAKH